MDTDLSGLVLVTSERYYGKNGFVILDRKTGFVIECFDGEVRWRQESPESVAEYLYPSATRHVDDAEPMRAIFEEAKAKFLAAHGLEQTAEELIRTRAVA